MAEPASQVVRSLFVTLRRGLAGKTWTQKRIIESIGLSKLHQCVEKPNTGFVRGMIAKVPHMVIVDTDRMFYLKRMREYHNQLCRPPLIVNHTHAASTAVAPRSTSFEQRQHVEHVLPLADTAGFVKLWLPKPPRPYDKRMAKEHKVKVLTEHGIYSSKVRELNERQLAAPLKRYGQKELKNE